MDATNCAIDYEEHHRPPHPRRRRCSLLILWNRLAGTARVWFKSIPKDRGIADILAQLCERFGTTRQTIVGVGISVLSVRGQQSSRSLHRGESPRLAHCLRITGCALNYRWHHKRAGSAHTETRKSVHGDAETNLRQGVAQRLNKQPPATVQQSNSNSAAQP